MKKLSYLLPLLLLTACFGPSEKEKRFNELRESLKTSSEEFQERNEDAKEAIIAKVEEDQSNPDAPTILRLTSQTEAANDSILAFLDEVFTDLEKMGDKSSDGEIRKKDIVEPCNDYFLGKDPSEQEGKAYELDQRFDSYTARCNWIRGQFANEISPFTSPAIGFEQDDTSWEISTFKDKPLIAHMAMIEKFKLDVSEMSRELLTGLNHALSQPTYKVETLKVR